MTETQIINLNREIEKLKNLESNFEGKLKELDELLGSLEYFFDNETLEKMNKVSDEMENIRDVFFKGGEEVDESIRTLSEEGIISKDEVEDYWESTPYADGWDHEEVCKCILCWTCSPKGYSESWANWYRMKGKKLKKEYEED